MERPKKVVPEFYGTILKINGHLQFKIDFREYFQKYLDHNFKHDQKVKIRIVKWYKPRSTGKEDEEGNQNGYLHAVILPMISDVTGYTYKESKSMIEAQCCRTEGFKGSQKILSIDEMNTIDFNWYVISEENPNSVRSWALSFLDLDIPLPDKNWRYRGYEASKINENEL